MSKKVVKNTSTNEIVYHSEPDFEDGVGIINTQQLFGYSPGILSEVSVTESEWNDHVNATILTNEFTTATRVYPVLCSYDTNANTGRFLEFWNGNSSDSSPFLLITNSMLVGIAVNSTASSTCTISIYKNGNFTTEITSISLSSQQSNYIANLQELFSAGDTISIKVTSGSVNKPGVTIYFTND